MNDNTFSLQNKSALSADYITLLHRGSVSKSLVTFFKVLSLVFSQNALAQIFDLARLLSLGEANLERRVVRSGNPIGRPTFMFKYSQGWPVVYITECHERSATLH